MKLAFIGFRHNHIFSLFNYARTHPHIQIVAACEEDPETRAKLANHESLRITHTNHRDLLSTVDCDAIAIGDYFTKRGPLAIASLSANKHVISDKPLCTSLTELDQIEHLCQSKSLHLGCLLDLRDHGTYRAMRELIHTNTIGQIQTLSFSAQHPLFPSTRPDWYFDPAKHGGTITDIAIHALDLIPWLTGQPISSLLAARTWNARPDLPLNFPSGAQLMLQLANGAGVLGDCSYLSPDSLAYSAPQYWRLTLHGTSGLLEANYNSPTLSLTTPSDKTPRLVPPSPTAKAASSKTSSPNSPPPPPPNPPPLTTQTILQATRQTLQLQSLANHSH